MTSSVVVMAAAVALYTWQDNRGFDAPCYDGARYTSGKPQPYPFHRRFCGWNKTALQIATVCSMLAVGAMLGDWKKALIFASLPGVWFCSVHKTTVDLPAMACAIVAAFLYPINPWFALLASCVGGFIHERAPVFAALYAMCLVNS